jgi:transcriptional regulator with XRE-family HTH domain
MMTNINKGLMPHQITVETFRRRLATVIARAGTNPAAFARSAGLDRSTLSQLLAEDAPRLPRAETLVAIAGAGRVSIDWLLGLSQREAIGAEIIEAVLQIEPHHGLSVDDCFVRWLDEAEGYRIRTAPAAIPDFLKTPDVLRHEYRAIHAADPQAAVDTIANRLAVMRRPESEQEVCCSMQAIAALARGEVQWAGLNRAVRSAAMQHMTALVRELYPSLRIYLYDVRNTFTVPFTVFGPKRVAIFLGPSFLVLSSAEHIRLFARRFDDLIRAAEVQPHAVADHIDKLRAGR